VPDMVEVAALSGLVNAVSNLGKKVDVVNANVHAVHTQATETRNELEALIAEFREFVAVDARAKSVALAETRLIKTRQEIEKEFGAYDEIRRRATGILRTVDSGIVREETIRTATEEMMLGAARYWLAPALVALAAWIADNRDLAERALAEAIRRDDYKTSLFFALISRRAGKFEAAAAWLDRYFRLQDPYALDREVIVLLDAIALGVFGRESRMTLLSGIRGWLDEVASKEEFVAKERSRWRSAFGNAQGAVDPADYPTLSSHSPTWSALASSLAAARGHGEILIFLGNVLDGEIVIPPSLNDRVDDILDHLVTDFDDEELSLRRTERQLELIIEHDGDRARADATFVVEAEGFDEKATFVSVLTSASLNVSGTGLTLATQRIALSLSRNWVIEGYDEHVASVRSSRPQKYSLTVDGPGCSWSGTFRDAQDEDQAVEGYQEYMTEQEAVHVRKLWRNWKTWIWGAAAVLLVLWSFRGLGSVGILFALVVAGVQAYTVFALRRKERNLHAAFESAREAGVGVIRRSMAEWQDYGRHWEQSDGIATLVRQRIDVLSPEEFFGGATRERIAS